MKQKRKILYIKWITTVILALLFYLIIPYVGITLIIRNYPFIKSIFAETLSLLILVGIVLTILSFLNSYLRKGTKQKYFTNCVYIIFLLAWLYLIFGGRMVLSASYYGNIFFIDITNLFYLLLLVLFLNFLYYTFEYVVYRRKLVTRNQ
ncbi:MAG: hypothetical protein AB1779_02970 [Candidatus Thermoplasmatota archaeon]